MQSKVFTRVELILGLVVLFIPYALARNSCVPSQILTTILVLIGALLIFFGLYSLFTRLKSPLRGIVAIFGAIILGLLAWLVPIMANFGRCLLD